MNDLNLKCKCGEELLFNDNSISMIGGEEIPMYYCPKCDKVWDGIILENEGEYVKAKPIYKEWFTKEAFIKIKNRYINIYQQRLKELDNDISRL